MMILFFLRKSHSVLPFRQSSLTRALRTHKTGKARFEKEMKKNEEFLKIYAKIISEKDYRDFVEMIKSLPRYKVSREGQLSRKKHDKAKILDFLNQLKTCLLEHKNQRVEIPFDEVTLVDALKGMNFLVYLSENVISKNNPKRNFLTDWANHKLDTIEKDFCASLVRLCSFYSQVATIYEAKSYKVSGFLAKDVRKSDFKDRFAFYQKITSPETFQVLESIIKKVEKVKGIYLIY
jgi:hypothetical protein